MRSPVMILVVLAIKAGVSALWLKITRPVWPSSKMDALAEGAASAPTATEKRTAAVQRAAARLKNRFISITGDSIPPLTENHEDYSSADFFFTSAEI